LDVESSSTLLQPSDISPASFYFANGAQRAIRGNAAVGGFAGFFFPVLLTAIGSFRNDGTQPFKSGGRILTFDGNSAHSCGGAWNNQPGVYVGGLIQCLNADCTTLKYKTGRGHQLMSRDPDQIKNLKVIIARWRLFHKTNDLRNV
jgi:hypothetical protein